MLSACKVIWSKDQCTGWAACMLNTKDLRTLTSCFLHCRSPAFASGPIHHDRHIPGRCWQPGCLRHGAMDRRPSLPGANPEPPVLIRQPLPGCAVLPDQATESSVFQVKHSWRRPCALRTSSHTLGCIVLFACHSPTLWGFQAPTYVVVDHACPSSGASMCLVVLSLLCAFML